jgi:hypothetical protein
MSDCIQEGVLPIVAADLADKEDGIQHDAGDQQQSDRDAEDQRQNLAPVEDDPADIEGDGQHHQADTQQDGKHGGGAAALNAHKEDREHLLPVSPV